MFHNRLQEDSIFSLFFLHSKIRLEKKKELSGLHFQNGVKCISYFNLN